MANTKNNIQDMVLNGARKEKMEITIYLTNGVPLKGRVVSFDNFTVVIESDGKQSLVSPPGASCWPAICTRPRCWILAASWWAW